MEQIKAKRSGLLALILVAAICLSLGSACGKRQPGPSKKDLKKAALEKKARRFPLIKFPLHNIGLSELAVFTREPMISSPAWSPDGKKVAYVVSRVNKEQGDFRPVDLVYVAGAEGEGPLLIAENAYSPVWSPDGKKLAYFSYPPEEREKEAVWLSNIDGSEKMQLTSGASSLAWSPDGQKIAVLKREHGSASASLWVVNAQSSVEIRLASEVGWDKLSWFPDGKRLAFISEDEAPHQVAVVGVDGKGFKKLTNMLSACSQPSVSPDGKKVLFIQVREEGYEGPDLGEVYAVDAEGGEPETVLAGRTWQGPVWSPDGERFACGGRALALVDYETRARLVLGAEAKSCWNPVWSPGATEIFYFVPESEWGGRLYRLKLKAGAETHPLYLLICGSFLSSYPEAYNLVSSLRSQVGFLPSGFPEIADSDVYSDLTPGFSLVLGGIFTTKEQADGVSAQLKAAGFSPTVRKTMTSDISFYFPAGAIIKKIVYIDLDKNKQNEIVVAYETTNGADWQGYAAVLRREGEGLSKIWEQNLASAGFDNYVDLFVRDINDDGVIELCSHWGYDHSVERFFVYRVQSDGIFQLQVFEADQGLSYQWAGEKLEVQTKKRIGRRGKVSVEKWQWKADRFEVVSSEAIAP